MTGVGLGWLQGTIKRVEPQQVLALLAHAIGSEAEDRPGGTRWYSESTTIGLHALAAWAPRNRPDAVETYFEVRQSALDELGGAAALKLAADLQDAGARMSRADGYYDDRSRHAEPAAVAEAFRHGDALTHIRRIREIREFVASGTAAGVILDGATLYIGSPKSDAMVRIYDKAAESGRSDAGIRWELQVRGEQAVRFVAGAVAAGEDLGAYVLGCIRGLVDFRDRTGQERGDRAPLLDWWSAIVADAARVGLNGPAKVDSLARRGAWLARQAAPSLALLYFALGADWLNALLLSGEERLTEAEWRLLGARHAAP
jgi:phage replication initiation protein